MYGQESLLDYTFIMLYGGVCMLVMAAGLYLWLRRNNAIAPAVNPPTALRRWTAAFFLMAALSHVWWYVIGVYWLTDDRLIRNTVTIALDRITLVPLVMALLLNMLQDCRRRLWPWVVAHIPIVVFTVVGIAKHDVFIGIELVHYWQLAVILLFVIYYIRSLVQYGRWLHENYVDLEHKEVWQSLVFVIVLFVVYDVYTTNAGEMIKEYLAQVITIVIVGFLIWRVETLQQLENVVTNKLELPPPDANSYNIPENIEKMLEKHCENTQLYLRHDLTLQQLSTAIGTNRTYLSAYFAQRNITYNTYINSLRIEHFIRIYRENKDSLQSITALQLAHESGFYNYNTFSSAFKRYVGFTVAEWMKSEDATKPST